MTLTGKADLSIWGASEGTAPLIGHLRQAGFQIGHIVSHERRWQRIEGIQVVPPEAYRATIDSTIPLVIDTGAGESADGRSFLAVQERIRDRWGLNDVQILHPLFLADHLFPRFAGKAAIIGCNRSGSTFLFHLCKAVLDLHPQPPAEGLQRFLQTSARDHLQTVDQLLTGAFQGEGAGEGAGYCAQGATRFGGMDFFGAAENRFFFLAPFPCRRYLFDTVHRSYSLLDRSIVQRLSRSGYALLTPLRNPLDIIVSNAFELEYVFFHMFPGGALDRVESGVREAYGRRFLADPAWFEQMALYVKRNMEAYLELADHTTGIRYEMLLSDPRTAMRRLASALDRDDDDETLAEIWKRHAFKPLAAFKSHYFRPGEGKWKQYLGREQLRILADLDYGDLLDALEYPLDLSGGGADLPPLPPVPGADMALMLAVRDAIFSLQFDTRCSQNHPAVTVQMAKPPLSGLGFSSNDGQFFNRFQRLKSDGAFQDLYQALTV